MTLEVFLSILVSPCISRSYRNSKGDAWRVKESRTLSVVGNCERKSIFIYSVES